MVLTDRIMLFHDYPPYGSDIAQVLDAGFGLVPGYVVLPWLVRYNVAAGLFGVVAGLAVWRAAPWAIAATAVLATAHLTVLIVLAALRIAGSEVANDSLGAMALRVAIWTGIALVARRGSRTHAVR